MNRCKVVFALGFVIAAPWSAGAQDADSPYRISLRNVPPFVPAPGSQLDLPRRDGSDPSVHALVQLDVAEVARARTEPDAQTRLRRLFNAEPSAPLRLQRNVQRTTYEAVIGIDLARALNMQRSLAPLALLDRDAATLVRWVGTVPREAKFETGLLNREYQPWGVGPDNTFNLLVTFYEDAVDEADALLGGLAREHTRYTANIWRIVLAQDRLDELVDHDSVRSVAMGPKPFTPINDKTRTRANVDTVQNANVMVEPPTYQGLTGAGVTVAVMDVGVTDDHDDFFEQDAAGNPTTVSRVKHHTAGTPVSLHGTHIAGIIGGSGYRSNRGGNGGTAYQWRGMAPRVKILSFSNVNSGGDVATQYQATVMGGADVSNDSHEQEDCLIYEGIAETVDSLVRGTEPDLMTGALIPPRAAIWGAGNNGQFVNNPAGCKNKGWFGLTVAAKNPIVVGETYVEQDLLYPSSSLGPTYDGRLKPDVVAPGCAFGSTPVGLKSTAMLDSGFPPPLAVANGYARQCGTSMATAVVSGISALLLEKWREKLKSTGQCQIKSNGECFPLPSTLKALLIQGAKDLPPLINPAPNAPDYFVIPDNGMPLEYHEGPDYASGYGLVDAAASVAIVDAGILGPGRRVVEGKAVASTTPDEFLIVVPQNAPRLRVTLAWDDERGDEMRAPTDPQLTNNLDLELVGPSTSTTTNPVFLPWTLPQLTPNPGSWQDPVAGADIVPATRGVDNRNNVEQVEVLPTPGESAIPAGPYRVRVKGEKLADDASQEYSLASDYALVSTFGGPPPPPPPPVQPSGSERTPCQELEWDRAPGGGTFTFDFESGRCGFIPLESICRYVVNCGVCDGFGICPATRMSLTQVPEFFRVEMRRRDRTPVAADESRRPVRALTWQPAAGEEYGLFFEPVGSARPAGRHTIGIEVSTQAAENPR